MLCKIHAFDILGEIIHMCVNCIHYHNCACARHVQAFQTNWSVKFVTFLIT